MSSEVNKPALVQEASLLVDFVNTLDVEEGRDEIEEPGRLRAWIAARTGEHIHDIGEADLRRALALRESLRALLRANNGGAASARDLLPLQEAAERSRYRPTLAEGGRLTFAPARSDLSGFEARLLLALERLQSHGVWPRLKACPHEECQWAFYDATRNHSRSWCSMDVCGNREKTRRYRRRKSSRA